MKYNSFIEMVENENLNTEDVFNLIRKEGVGELCTCAFEIREQFTISPDDIESEIEEYLNEQGYERDEFGEWYEVE